MTDSATTKHVAIAATIDVVVILAFVAIGRRSHNEGGSTLAETLKVAAPFLIALALGWLAARAWQAPMAVTTGIVVWLVTVAGGLVLRRVVFDGGTAMPFIIVASAFTLMFLVGWRAVAEWRTSRGAARV